MGGDWYDVIELGDRRLGFVIGDVAGHGMAAATFMGQLRSAIRAYALDTEAPAEVITKLAQFSRPHALTDGDGRLRDPQPGHLGGPASRGPAIRTRCSCALTEPRASSPTPAGRRSGTGGHRAYDEQRRDARRRARRSCSTRTG